MRIMTVRFRRLQSHDRGYGHDAVEAEAAIGEGEAPEQALAELKAWVLEQLGRAREIDRQVENLQSLNSRVAQKERELEHLRASYARGRELIRTHEKLATIARATGLVEEARLLEDDGVPF